MPLFGSLSLCFFPFPNPPYFPSVVAFFLSLLADHRRVLKVPDARFFNPYRPPPPTFPTFIDRPWTSSGLWRDLAFEPLCPTSPLFRSGRVSIYFSPSWPLSPFFLAKYKRDFPSSCPLSSRSRREGAFKLRSPLLLHARAPPLPLVESPCDTFLMIYFCGRSGLF